MNDEILQNLKETVHLPDPDQDKEDIIRMDLKWMGRDGTDWINMDKNRCKWTQ